MALYCILKATQYSFYLYADENNYNKAKTKSKT